MLADASRRLSCDAARDSFFCLKHTNIRARLPALPRLIFWARCSAAALSTVARRPAAASPHCLTQGVGRWHATRLSSVSRRPAALSLKSNTLLLKNGLGEERASGLTATDSHVWAEHRRQSDVTPSPPDTTRAGGRETRRRVFVLALLGTPVEHHVTSAWKQKSHFRRVFLPTARTSARNPQRFRAHFFMFGLAALHSGPP